MLVSLIKHPNKGFKTVAAIQHSKREKLEKKKEKTKAMVMKKHLPSSVRGRLAVEQFLLL